MIVPVADDASKKIGTPQQFLTFLESERRDWIEAVGLTGVKID